MYLAGEGVAEAEEVDEVDIDHTQADSCSMNSHPPDRGLEEVGQAEDIDHKALQACHTVRSNQRHRDRWERSVVAEEAVHTDRKELRRSVADIDHSVAGSRTDAVAEAGVVDAEATMTDIVQDMVVEVDVAGDVADELTGEGALGSGEGVGVGGHGEQAREDDVGAEVGRT